MLYRKMHEIFYSYTVDVIKGVYITKKDNQKYECDLFSCSTQHVRIFCSGTFLVEYHFPAPVSQARK